MPYSSYTTLAGLSLGETSFTLERGKVTDSYVDFVLKIYGDKWQKSDIAFEYRFNNYDQWRTDAYIVGSQSTYIQGNKLLGLSSSSQGFSNQFRWQYSNNNILGGMQVQLRLRLLPRTKHYSYYNNSTVISEAYGESFFDAVTTNRKCIGQDLYGRYICISDGAVSIYETLTSSYPLYVYYCDNPRYVKQIRSGNYIVAIYGSNSVIELNSTLSSIVKSISVDIPIYFDYSEQNETLLIVRYGFSTIIETTWSIMDYGNVIWTSNSVLTNPNSATYNTNNFDEIVCTDQNNVHIINKLANTYIVLNKYGFSNGIGDEKSKAFWHPYRAYFYDDDTICVVEKDGEIINFESLYSSSSSSIDSSSSSTSSSSSSSSTSESSSSSSSSTSSSSSSSSSSTTSSSSSSSTSESSSSSSTSESSSSGGIGVMIIESTFIVG